MASGKSPVREYRTILEDSGDAYYVNRILIATPVTGLVRIEWVAGRYGQMIPVNWSQVNLNDAIQGGYYPLRYQVADAQNMIVQRAIERDFEWLLLWEHDVIAPPDAIIKLNEYITNEEVPIVSGLYYTRSRSSDPLIFRGRGTGAYKNWKMGQKVWCDGVPTGFLLIHMGIIRAMWDESPEYVLKNQVVRRVFDTPRKLWYDPESGSYNSMAGTSDLEWCTRIMKEGFFKKAGWDKYQRKKYPFLVDTAIFCRHINEDGEQFP